MKIIKTGRPTIMGILNLTPDSFSDGGQYNTIQKALRRVRQMEQEGADIIDIGGESTGPKSANVSLQEELDRVIPILKKIRKHTKLQVSIDTYKSEVARIALEEGADMINDVTALRQGKKLAGIVAKYRCPLVLMYSKDNIPRTTIKKVHYKDVMLTIKNFLKKRIDYAQKEGIAKKNIIIDPGMGQFISAIPKYSFEIIARLRELKSLNHPILIGISRKSFLGGELQNRDEKSSLLQTIAYLNGASILRTHNVKATRLCLTWN